MGLVDLLRVQRQYEAGEVNRALETALAVLEAQSAFPSKPSTDFVSTIAHLKLAMCCGHTGDFLRSEEHLSVAERMAEHHRFLSLLTAKLRRGTLLWECGLTEDAFKVHTDKATRASG